MIISIEYKKDDDKVFMTGLNRLVARSIPEFKPQDVYVFRINKWFDHKWLRYSGYGVIAFLGKQLGPNSLELPPQFDTCKEEKYQDHLTFPPFNPKQMGRMEYWSRYDDGTYGGVDKPRWPILYWRKPNNSHLQHRVTSFTNSGLFVWFTSNTESNQKGSVMVYRVQDGQTEAWFASLGCNPAWKVQKVKGIQKELVEDWFDHPLK